MPSCSCANLLASTTGLVRLACDRALCIAADCHPSQATLLPFWAFCPYCYAIRSCMQHANLCSASQPLQAASMRSLHCDSQHCTAQYLCQAAHLNFLLLPFDQLLPAVSYTIANCLQDQAMFQQENARRSESTCKTKMLKGAQPYHSTQTSQAPRGHLPYQKAHI